MNLAELFLLVIALLFLSLLVFKLFSTPLRMALKVIINSALGFFALIALDMLSPPSILHIGVNFVNALIVGILGLPGLVLLLLTSWVVS